MKLHSLVMENYFFLNMIEMKILEDNICVRYNSYYGQTYLASLSTNIYIYIGYACAKWYSLFFYLIYIFNNI